MISHQRAQQLLHRFADLLDATPDEIVDLIDRQVDRRTIEGRRITRIRFVRTGASGRYVLDRWGTDLLPPGYEMPT